MEGNEDQRRQRAREARSRGKEPSAEQVTKGASKQRHHLPRDEDHPEKMETLHKGKQRVQEHHDH